MTNDKTNPTCEIRRLCLSHGREDRVKERDGVVKKQEEWIRVPNGPTCVDGSGPRDGYRVATGARGASGERGKPQKRIYSPFTVFVFSPLPPTPMVPKWEECSAQKCQIIADGPRPNLCRRGRGGIMSWEKSSLGRCECQIRPNGFFEMVIRKSAHYQKRIYRLAVPKREYHGGSCWARWSSHPPPGQEFPGPRLWE